MRGATLIEADFENDIALLSVPKDPPLDQIDPLPIIECDNSFLRNNKSLSIQGTISGFPLGLQSLVKTKGQIVGFEQKTHRFWIIDHVVGGLSGSAFLTDNPKGIFCLILGAHPKGTYAFGRPTDAILMLIHRNGLKPAIIHYESY